MKPGQAEPIDEVAAFRPSVAHIPLGLAPWAYAGTICRPPLFAADFRRERAERLAIERAENEGMTVGRLQKVSCDTHETGQSGGMAGR